MIATLLFVAIIPVDAAPAGYAQPSVAPPSYPQPVVAGEDPQPAPVGFQPQLPAGYHGNAGQINQLLAGAGGGALAQNLPPKEVNICMSNMVIKIKCVFPLAKFSPLP